MITTLLSRTAVWVAILGASLAGIVIIVLAALIGDPANDWAWLETLRGHADTLHLTGPLTLVGRLAQNDAIFGATVGILLSAVSLSWAYLVKIPGVRRAAIEALAYGYYENFLIRLVHKCARDHPHYRIVIVMPTFELVENPDIYMNSIKSILARMGFTTEIELSDDSFGRNAFFVQRQNDPPLPLYIDAPTTLKTLRKILEIEANMPVGKVVKHRWWQRRFIELRNTFQAVLEERIPADSWGNVVFLDSEDQKKFSATLEAEIAKLEGEIADPSKPR